MPSGRREVSHLRRGVGQEVWIPVATLCNWIKHSDKLLKAFSVSYTHLTLPTIYSV